MKRLKNNLDERQEQELLYIEHNGVWLAFWGLLAAIIVQCITGVPWREIAGEWIVFMALCVYLLEACIRKGIWDRYLRPNFKTNAAISFFAGLATALITAVMMWRNLGGHMEYRGAVILCTAIAGGFTFAICLIALSISAGATKKRQEKLEKETSEEEDSER